MSAESACTGRNVKRLSTMDIGDSWSAVGAELTLKQAEIERSL
jgi:hypothetical protein